jgi:hypothetical protein
MQIESKHLETAKQPNIHQSASDVSKWCSLQPHKTQANIFQKEYNKDRFYDHHVFGAR